MRTKYNSKKTSYNGSSYHSALEARYARMLDLRVKAGEVKEWKGQHKIALRVNDQQITNYFIDFRVVNIDGSIDYVEVKGFETDTWRLKWKITQALFGEIAQGENARLVLVKNGNPFVSKIVKTYFDGN